MMRRLAPVLVAATALLTVTAPAAAPQDEVGAGRQVFEANCAMCHGTDASGMMGMHPSLRGAIDRLTREGAEVTIRHGRNTNPPMPAFEARLNDREIDQVIAYIETLPPGPRNFGPDVDGGGGMMDGMMGGWMWLVPLLLVIAIVVAIIAAVRYLGDRGRSSGRPSPRELLDQRYAAGEIDRQEYLQRREDLDS